jgi:hypothetical protein
MAKLLMTEAGVGIVQTIAWFPVLFDVSARGLGQLQVVVHVFACPLSHHRE